MACTVSTHTLASRSASCGPSQASVGKAKRSPTERRFMHCNSKSSTFSIPSIQYVIDSLAEVPTFSATTSRSTCTPSIPSTRILNRARNSAHDTRRCQSTSNSVRVQYDGVQFYASDVLARDMGHLAWLAAPTRPFSKTGGAKGVGAVPGAMAAVEGGGAGRFYFNITGFPFPLGPFLERRTVRREVEKGRIWMLEQEQALGFSSVTTNIRMTVIKLTSGGLWVHAPIAPTDECIQLLNELEAPVEFIVLPTFAYEHKIFVGPFSRKYPRAKVWVAPRQWSWPINLPLQFFGIFKAKVLEDGGTSAPWADEIDHKILTCSVGIGPYVEVAFYHKKSQTLLVTDAVIYVPERPPEVVGKEALLSAARNGLAVKLLSKGKEVPNDPVVDNEANRQRGWERMVLQILFLGPSNLLEPKKSFAQMSKKLIVSPIIKTLVFTKVPAEVKGWVNSIAADWRFKCIIPAHFAAPITANGRDLKIAFSFLNDLLSEEESEPIFQSSIARFFSKASSVFPAADMKTLSSLDNFLVSVGAVRKTVSGKARR